MAEYIITPINGAAEFPANENEYYGYVETLAYQNIQGVKSTNRLYDAMYFVDLTNANGNVLEFGLIDKAKAQTYDKEVCTKTPVDPKTVARYFNNWLDRRFDVTVRREEIRKIIANKGTGNEEVVDAIISGLTEGRDGWEFENARELLFNANVKDYTETLGGTPKNLKGVVYTIRDMYDTLRTDNSGFDITTWKTHTPEADIRIAISTKFLNLIGVSLLADTLHLTEVELWGKLVVVPVSDLDKSKWYQVIVYDRKAMVHARRKDYMDNDKCASAGFWNYYLFVEDLFAYNPIFKATKMDFTTIATTELSNIITPSAARQAQPQK